MGGRSVLLTSNLPQLQNLIKRDPPSYKDEFLQQWNHYNSIRLIFHLNPDEHAQHFRELVAFIAQVSTCYPKETAEFPSHISTILIESYGLLSPDTRKALISTMVLLRNKNVITSIELLRTLFPLLPRTTSSSLRANIRKTILSDIRTANIRAKNHKLNRAIQAMLFGMVENGLADISNFGNKGKQKEVNNGVHFGTTDKTAGRGEDAMWAVILTKELWRKGIWNDVKPVSIVAIGCLHPVLKVQSASMHFFLGDDDRREDSDEEDEEDVDVRSLHHRREINKKTRSGDKKLQKKLNTAKKKKHGKTEKSNANFPALQLLNDPQTFAEKLFTILDRYDKRFTLDHKILIMQLLARVISAHTLFVMPFYSYVQKWLAPKQLRVPSILVALAQSVHSLIPPQTLKPVVVKLANEFVHPGVGSEVTAAGINAITEICRRQPLVMGPRDDDDDEPAKKSKEGKQQDVDSGDVGASEAEQVAREKEKADIINMVEDGLDGKKLSDKDVDLRPLLNDLIEYRKSKDKTVIAASRGLLHLYRETHPEFLKKRERGKEATINMKTSAARNLPFGHSAGAAVDIEGLLLLESHFKQLREAEEGSAESDQEDDAGWEGWDVESDSESDSDSEDGWQNVSSDSDGDIEISDSEDENGEKKEKDKNKSRETERQERRRGKKERLEKRRVKEEALKNGEEIEGDLQMSDDEDDKMDVDGEPEKEATAQAISTLATTKILTPADFKLLSDLRVQAAQKSVEEGGGNRAKHYLELKNPSEDPSAAFISENDILGPRKKAKADYADRMASIQKGREGREKYGSRKGKKTKDAPSSSTNKEKARNKPIMMILSSGSVKGKKKASLREKQRKLRAHIDKGKKGRK
ncbi:SDA1-domain-containing protein [Rhodocollybia butyracea]|uniref:Protein SDA1 n=1 Tax=Rhodocollybia butyracea TaxID=206335 RepID=A0A9P5PY66_9AGAR|nr:SDA1-domain-containing protein [Rhodocollybia butyracea]